MQKFHNIGQVVAWLNWNWTEHAENESIIKFLSHNWKELPNHKNKILVV